MVISSISPPLNKEIAIRRRMASIFTKREEDFPSLRDYGDYLEEVEDMTLKLIEGIDVAAIEAKIAKYMEENSEQMLINLARKSENQNSQAGFVTPIFHRQSLPTGMAPQSLPLIGDDMLGHAGGDMPRSTGMTPQALRLGGGEDEETMKLRAERTARAGGWTRAEMSRKRAREEAFESMWP